MLGVGEFIFKNAMKGGEPPFAAVCTKVSYAQLPEMIDHIMTNKA
jgi:hypothetical protein